MNDSSVKSKIDRAASRDHIFSETKEIKVSRYIAKFLKNRGVTCVFELSGGMIMELIDSIHLESGVDIVNMHHEQGAAFAADAVGRLSGVPGVAIATSGPGAINLLTGVGSCFFDSSPAVFITGQVNTAEQKGSRDIRQLGFQETDIVSMAAPITKYAYQVRTAKEIPTVLDDAFRIAVDGRPGAVLIDIPMELFRSLIDTNDNETGNRPAARRHVAIDAGLLDQLLADLRRAERPLILAGGGVRASGSAKVYGQLVERLGVPVVASLMAVDCIPRDVPSSVGMIGTYGNRWANLAVSMSDFILVLGSRLDIRQTGADTDSFKGDRTIYHVAVEAGEINCRVKGCHAVVADLKDFIPQLLQLLPKGESYGKQMWEDTINKLKDTWPDVNEISGIQGINPNYFMHQLSKGQQAAAYVVDVGQHQMWAAQSLDLYRGQRFLTSGGMGAMGFALPAAVGAAYATNREEPILVIAGDAGFQLNIQELQTVVRNKLPIKMVVINNQCHGMTRQFQETYFGARYQGTVWGYDTPDFATVAEAYGVQAATIRETDEIEAALLAMWRTPLEPFLLQVMIETSANVYPKLAFGRPISEMEPLAKPIAMEST
jgi:acetolactate synthase-1/2/3 large subunit